MSGTMGKIIGTSGSVVSRLEAMSKKQKELQGVTGDLGGSIFFLKQKIDLLQAEKELIHPSNLNQIRQYNREIAELEKQIDKLENTGKPKSLFGGLGEELKSYINPATIAMTAIAFSTKSAMNFDEGMAKVNVTAQLDEKGLNDLKDKIKKIAKDNKQVISVAPEGFESIISQVGEVDQSLEILDAAMKGSRAGFTDLSVVSGALAQSLSVIGKENGNAQEVLDTFLAAKRVGAGEFADFANYLPNLIAGASNLGIAYKEVAGTYAFMTGKGQSAERAAVLMQNAFSVLGKGDIRKNLEKIGVQIFDNEGKVRGMVDVFKDFSGVMGGLNDEAKSNLLEKLGITDKEAKNAFAILTSDIGGFQEAMEATKDSAGETEAALELSGNSVQKSTDLWNKLQNIGFSLGESVLPVLNVGLDIFAGILWIIEPILNGVFNLFSYWFDALQKGNPWIWALAIAVAALTIAYHKDTIVLKANELWIKRTVIAEKLKAGWDAIVTASTNLWTGSQWLLNAALDANPIGLVVLAVAALIAIVTVVINKYDEWGAALTLLLGPFGTIINIVQSFRKNWDSIKTAFTDGGILAGIKRIGYVLIDALLYPVQQLLELIAKIPGMGNIAKSGAEKIASMRDKLDKATYVPKKQNDNLADATFNQTETIVDRTVLDDKEIDSLLKKLDKDKKNKGKKNKTEKIDINNPVMDLKGSSAYSAIVSKLNPVHLASLATKAAATVAIPAMLATGAAAAVPGSPVKEFDTAKTEYVQEKDSNPIPVKIVDLSATALALFPKSNINVPEPVTKLVLPEQIIDIKMPEQVANITVPDPIAKVVLPEPVIDVKVPEQVANITAPDPVSKLVLPEPIIDVKVPEQVANITVPDPVSKVVLPEPIIDVKMPEQVANINVPNPIVKVVLPEPIIDVKMPEQVANINVPDPVTNVTIPQSVSPFVLEETADNQSATPESKGRNIQIDRFCDQIVIHIANADSKGYEQIRSEVEKVLMDVLDDYDA